MNDSPRKVVKKPVWPKIARYEMPPNESILEATSDEEEEICPSINRPLTPPVREMSKLSLKSNRVRKAVLPTPGAPAVTRNTRSAPLPTWAQMKKLAQVAEHRLQEERLPKTEVNLMLSMMAVLSVVSCFPLGAAAANFTYWAYIPNPPLLTPVTWNDDPPLIYINDSSWFPGPEDPRGPEFPEEEGRLFTLFNHSALGYLHTPICIGSVPPCLSLMEQTWTIPSGIENNTFKDLFMISSKGFVTQQSSTHSFPPSIPTCPLINHWDKNQSRIHWDECRGTIDRIIINNTLETIIDWGPFGPALQVCNIKECSELRQLKDQIIGNNLPRIEFEFI
ncbi:endogenous retrovirus group K member 25 Env polyprotein-like [Hipposideros larvatus]